MKKSHLGPMRDVADTGDQPDELLADFVQRALALKPPLTDEKIETIALLLEGGKAS